MNEAFFAGWGGMGKVAICSLVAYLALFTFIRISGKRTMSKLNAFDFVVAVTLGSTLSSMILAKVAIAEGLLAVGVIIGLQYILAKLAMESPAMEKIINSQPSLLFYDGRFLEKTLSRECITHEEIHAAVREYRLENMDDVRAVVMELNGNLTVVRKQGGVERSSLSDVVREEIPEIP